MGVKFIDNQALVIKQFGIWPSFHDAEIAGLYLRRNEPGGWPTISLWINLSKPVVPGAGYEDASLWQLELEFSEVIDNEFEGFNHQNVILLLSFQQDKAGITCLIETSYGLSGSITARRVAVKSLLPVNRLTK